MKFINAIVTYGENSSKRHIYGHVSDLDKLGKLIYLYAFIGIGKVDCDLINVDDVARQVAALKILSDALGKEKRTLDFFMRNTL